MDLEKLATSQNLKSRLKNESLILKVPTPIVLTSKGLVAQSSTVDFVGLLDGGMFIAFDAKETSVTTRFDLKNIKGHQLEYLQVVKGLGGLAFFLIHFKKVYADELFVVPISLIEEHWNGSKSSIPLADIEKGSFKVPKNNYLVFLKNESYIKKLLRV